jgi:hypothetical protein
MVKLGAFGGYPPSHLDLERISIVNQTLLLKTRLFIVAPCRRPAEIALFLFEGFLVELTDRKDDSLSFGKYIRSLAEPSGRYSMRFALAQFRAPSFLQQ